MNELGESRGTGGCGWGIWRLRLALLLFVLPAGLSLFAQNPPAGSGSIEGTLTDLYSKPLGGTRVVLRNVSTGAEFEAVTSKSGFYRLAGLAPGSYVLEARIEKVTVGRASGILVTPGRAARVQTAIALEGQTAGAWQAARTTWLGKSSIASAPIEAARSEKPTKTQRHDTEAFEVTTVSPARGMIPTVPSLSSSLAAAAMELGLTAWTSLQAGMQMQSAPPRQIEEALSRPEPSAVTTTLTGDELQTLPLNGRELDAATLDSAPTATVQDEEGNRVGVRTSARGSIDDDTHMTFDGRGAARRSAAAMLAPATSEATSSILRIGVGGESDGRAVTTRSGAGGGPGRLHGRAFFFNRSGLLAAQNPFSEWTKETAPGTAGTVPVFGSQPWSPSDRRNRWGLGLGGPIERNRLFWFAAFENQLRNDPAVASVKHADRFFAQPTNDEMQVLAARLGLGSADPVSEGLAEYSAMLETLSGLLGPTPRTSADKTVFARVDWRAAEQHRFTVEASGAQWNSPGGGLTQTSETYGSHSFGASRGSEIWLLGRWEAFLTPNLFAVTEGSMGRHILTHSPETPSAFEQRLNVNPWGQLPQMAVDSRYGFTIGNPARFGSGSYPDEHIYQAHEDVEWLRGSIAVHSGFGLRYAEDATSFIRNQTGTYHYSRLENFVSDALVFEKFGLANALDPNDQHNCDPHGKAWRDSEGGLQGLGHLPCYSFYTQTVGPTEWHLETTDLDGFTTAQWKPQRTLVMSAGLRWERQKMPPSIALVNNPDLPLAGVLPSLGSEWAPRAGLAWGTHESRWPVVRLGYGMVYSRTPNSVLETALTQTGSSKGDMNLFLRPTDNLAGKAGGAPAFPNVLVGNAGATLQPGAVEVAPTYRNGEVHEGIASVEEELRGRVLVSASAMVTLGRRLPITIDTNFDPALNPGTITYDVVDAAGKGPIRTPQITVPFFASWPSDGGTTGRLNPKYEQVIEMMSRANSTYEAAILRVSRAARHGVGFNVRYTYGHAMDWNPDEGMFRTRASVLDPLDLGPEYGTSNLDLRHSAAGYVTWQSPWKLQGAAAHLANGWMLSSIGHFHSGLPYSMRTEGSLAEEFGSGGLVVALGPGMNGYGGANRVYGVGRNTYRYPATWKADVRLGKRFALGRSREIELMAQSFNLFNHQNVTELETVGYYLDAGSRSGALPRLNFLTGADGHGEFGQPLNVNATDSYRERQFEFGIGFRFKHELDR